MRKQACTCYWYHTWCLVTYTGCVSEPSLVMTPSLSISICLNVLTFCRISSSVYLQMKIKTHKHTFRVNQRPYTSLWTYCEFKWQHWLHRGLIVIHCHHATPLLDRPLNASWPNITPWPNDVYSDDSLTASASSFFSTWQRVIFYSVSAVTSLSGE